MSDNNPPSDALDRSKTLTIYGRKPVLEALSDPQLLPRRLHLADSNKSAGIITDIIKSADSRDIEIRYHDKRALSRISKNGKQDQGVALDIECPNFKGVDELAKTALSPHDRFLVLDGITLEEGSRLRLEAHAGVEYDTNVTLESNETSCDRHS